MAEKDEEKGVGALARLGAALRIVSIEEDSPGVPPPKPVPAPQGLGQSAPLQSATPKRVVTVEEEKITKYVERFRELLKENKKAEAFFLFLETVNSLKGFIRDEKALVAAAMAALKTNKGTEPQEVLAAQENAIRALEEEFSKLMMELLEAYDGKIADAKADAVQAEARLKAAQEELASAQKALEAANATLDQLVAKKDVNIGAAKTANEQLKSEMEKTRALLGAPTGVEGEKK